MEFPSAKPPATWWKQLAEYLHDATGHELRRLQIHCRNGAVTIQAIAPTEALKRQAEDAARNVVPANCLTLAISVAQSPEAKSPENGSSKKPRNRSLGRVVGGLTDPGIAVYRRLRSLTVGD
jgi:hypothetical protein